jgi:hypothetical protein
MPRSSGKTHDPHGSSPGREIAALLRPDRDDYFVLKPKHSGFQYTTLDVLLAHLAYMRDFPAHQ